jgi:hypothetical protein
MQGSAGKARVLCCPSTALAPCHYLKKVVFSCQLTPGLYEFKVTVDGQNAHGEGYVNVTVKPGNSHGSFCRTPDTEL